jgi:tripartite-type tricarboxylate transporter receptor subunit TctC
VGKLADEVNRILKLPDVTARIEALGLQVGGGKSEDFQKTLRTDAAIYARIIKEGNIKLAQ